MKRNSNNQIAPQIHIISTGNRENKMCPFFLTKHLRILVPVCHGVTRFCQLMKLNLLPAFFLCYFHSKDDLKWSWPLSLSLHVPHLSSLPAFPSSLPPTLSPQVCSVAHSLRLSFIQFMIQFLAEIISKQLLMTKATHGNICCCSKVDKSILGTKFRSAKFEP